jgi:hypothetical protein
MPATTTVSFLLIPAGNDDQLGGNRCLSLMPNSDIQAAQ